jgi:GT2 family glycosyltransferase
METPTLADAQGDARVLVVVVNYRTPRLTVECLESLAKEAAALPDVRGIVVDNDSGDESVPILRQAIAERGWSRFLTLIVSEKNLGFSGGNNLGIQAGEPAEYVLLLNSDAVLHEGSIQHCLRVMAGDPTIGAMSCCVLNTDGSIQNVARRFPSPARVTASALGLPWKWPTAFGWADTEDLGWDRRKEARDVDWLGGAFLFIRSSALDGRVRLDDEFFFYGEDVELCHRIHASGFSCRYDPGATVTHHGGASSDPSRMPSGARAAHRFRARYLLQRKCYGPWAALWVRALDVGVLGSQFLRARVKGRSQGARVEELRDRLKHVLGMGRAA